jgi:hypothetical protein
VWGEFRVARRAYPLFARLSSWDNDQLRFHGAHDGYRRLSGRLRHERRVRMSLAGRWCVEDQVSGGGEHRVQSFIHVHPDFDVRPSGDCEFHLINGGQAVATISITTRCKIAQLSGWYCPEFGLRRQNVVLCLETRGSLPLKLGYEIRKLSANLVA